ncbi:MAG TPA: hypothetical protein VF532_10745 [Candidatus Angelobacter sp.]
MSSASSYTARAFQPDEAARRPFPFRRVLPLGQLLLCTLLLWPYRARIAFELFGVRMSYNAPAPPQQIIVNAQGKIDYSSTPEFEKWVHAQENAFDTAAMLNVPVIFLDGLRYILSGNPQELKPRYVDFKIWRAVAWPLIALPFWWMAGRGAEALASARRKLIVPRLRWPETVISFLLMAGGLTLGVAFLLDADRSEPSLRLFATALAMWGILSSFTVVARLAQWRIRKKNLVHS